MLEISHAAVFCVVVNWTWIQFSVDNCLKDQGEKQRKEKKNVGRETHLEASLKVIHLLNPGVRVEFKKWRLRIKSKAGNVGAE